MIFNLQESEKLVQIFIRCVGAQMSLCSMHWILWLNFVWEPFMLYRRSVRFYIQSADKYNVQNTSIISSMSTMYLIFFYQKWKWIIYLWIDVVFPLQFIWYRCTFATQLYVQYWLNFRCYWYARYSSETTDDYRFRRCKDDNQAQFTK